MKTSLSDPPGRLWIRGAAAGAVDQGADPGHPAYRGRQAQPERARAKGGRRQTGFVRPVAHRFRRVRRQPGRGLKPTEVQPWATELYKQRMENLGKDDPGTFKCLPQGPRVTLGAGGWAKIIQTPLLVVILYENLSYRQIFLDGRALPTEPHPSFMGYSVGRWDGDTLVVESRGFKDTTWLDFGGHPHTEDLRVVERIRRPDFGRLDVQVTFEDPKVYSRSWTVPVKVDFVADSEMLEYVCNENERDYAHLVGKASDDKKNAVKVAREILSKYVGAYEFRSTEDPNLLTLVNVTLKGDELFVDVGGKDRRRSSRCRTRCSRPSAAGWSSWRTTRAS